MLYLRSSVPCNFSCVLLLVKESPAMCTNVFQFSECIFCSKPKNQRVKRALEHREPKLVENAKITMLIRGGNTSEVITEALKELVSLTFLSVCITYAMHSILI